MMSAATLSSEARTKLAKLCGMLGSDHAGERAAAGLKATEFVRSLGLSWADVFTNATSTQTPTPHEPGWRANLQFCQQHIRRCSEWERNYVASVSQRRSGLTPAQAAKLKQIADALRQQGCR